MNCLIIDDDLLAQEVIERHIGHYPGINLKGKCKNALEGFRLINAEKIDLIFLDIKMPEISGIDFMKSLKNPPKVIFTTAYPEFAIEGFNLEVLDYLLKPVSEERFAKAVRKLKNFFSHEQEKSIFIKTNRKQIKLNPSEILFIEGMENYLKIHTLSNEKEIVTHSTFKNLEQELSVFPYLVRVHKSFLVNLSHVKIIANNMLNIGNKQIPIGNNYKELFLQKIRTKIY